MPKLTDNFVSPNGRKFYKVEASGELRPSDIEPRVSKSRFQITKAIYNGKDPVAYGNSWYFAGSAEPGAAIVGSSDKLVPISLSQPADIKTNAIGEAIEAAIRVRLQVQLESYQIITNSWVPFPNVISKDDWFDIDPVKYVKIPAPPAPNPGNLGN